MMVSIKAHFNKQTKDSKKELVQFYVKGDDERKQELNTLCREVVELKIGDLEPLTAEFAKKTQDSKKTILDFIIKGDTSADRSFQFYRLAGADVDLAISSSQMSIEEFRGETSGDYDEDEDEDEGLAYEVNKDGTVEVKKQMDLNEALEQAAASEDDDKPKMPDEDDLPLQ